MGCKDTSTESVACPDEKECRWRHESVKELQEPEASDLKLSGVDGVCSSSMLERSAFASRAAELSLSSDPGWFQANELLRVSDRIVVVLASHVLCFRAAESCSHSGGRGATRVPRWLSTTET